MEYRVRVCLSTYRTITVEAETEDIARSKAKIEAVSLVGGYDPHIDEIEKLGENNE